MASGTGQVLALASGLALETVRVSDCPFLRHSAAAAALESAWAWESELAPEWAWGSAWAWVWELALEWASAWVWVSELAPEWAWGSAWVWGSELASVWELEWELEWEMASGLARETVRAPVWDCPFLRHSAAALGSVWALEPASAWGSALALGPASELEREPVLEWEPVSELEWERVTRLYSYRRLRFRKPLPIPQWTT